MPELLKIKGIKSLFIIYWFLLTYIIAALIWWFIALNRQNDLMLTYRIQELSVQQPDYNKQVDKINQEKRRKTAQFIGEGVTFFLLIVAGATFVCLAIRS